jgi:high-affinity nickel permease
MAAAACHADLNARTAMIHFLNNRGLLARLLRPMLRLIRRSWHTYPVGLLSSVCGRQLLVARLSANE